MIVFIMSIYLQRKSCVFQGVNLLLKKQVDFFDGMKRIQKLQKKDLSIIWHFLHFDI